MIKRWFLPGGSFLGGAVIGAGLLLVLTTLGKSGGMCLLRPAAENVSGREIVARIDGAVLLREDLRREIARDLVPVENDEYLIWEKSVKAWLEKKLLEKEAQLQGLSVEQLVQKEIWSKVNWVNATPAKDARGPGADQGKTPQEIRQSRYELAKTVYLKVLTEKYHGGIYLVKPESFVEGLGLPRSAAPPPSPAPAVSPSVPPSAARQGLSPEGTATMSPEELASRPAQGPLDAPVTLVEFSDFHCPFCNRLNAILDQVMQAYPGKVRRVFRHFPLEMHPGAETTHAASECAAEQGKFWEFRNAVYKMGFPPRAVTDLERLAQGIAGLDFKKFQQCLVADPYREKVRADIKRGDEIGVQGTPTFFINGLRFSGARSLEDIKSVIDEQLAKKS